MNWYDEQAHKERLLEEAQKVANETARKLVLQRYYEAGHRGFILEELLKIDPFFEENWSMDQLKQ